MRLIAPALAVAVVVASTAGAATQASRPHYGPLRLFGQSTVPGSVTATGAMATADFSGDGLPDVAIARAEGERPAVEILHAGWRGVLAGLVGVGARALGGRSLRAAIGPSIGPCCYEIGEEVATPFRQAFGEDVVRDGRLDLWTSAERALRAAGCEHVDRFDICTSCEADRFFSHRRDHGKTGRQGVIAYVT